MWPGNKQQFVPALLWGSFGAPYHPSWGPLNVTGTKWFDSSSNGTTCGLIAPKNTEESLKNTYKNGKLVNFAPTVDGGQNDSMGLKFCPQEIFVTRVVPPRDGPTRPACIDDDDDDSTWTCTQIVLTNA